jgi:hypothetical protein
MVKKKTRSKAPKRAAKKTVRKKTTTRGKTEQKSTAQGMDLLRSWSSSRYTAR